MPKTIAISFDDAPMYGGPIYTGVERTQLLLEALKTANTEAIFFSSPKGFLEPNSFERMVAYDQAGHLIANHTDMHNAASNTNFESNWIDIDNATSLLSGFENYRPWLRFPYLDEGSTLELRDAYRAAMDARGMSNGYVTVDVNDWYMNDKLAEAVDAGQIYNLGAFRDAYIDMILTAANYYDDLGQQTLGRSPAQVLLLHENDLAAMFIDDAIAALRLDGWQIITGDEAYSDPIAAIEPETIQTGRGRLAALAIDAGADYSILEHEGNTLSGIENLLSRHDVFESSNVIKGTSGDDFLLGTNADEVFVGNTGQDNFLGSAGSDSYYGEAFASLVEGAYDQIIYSGSREDYKFSQMSDGVVSVLKPDGSIDLLHSIEGFWFQGEEAWYSIWQVTNLGSAQETNGDDYLFGTDGNDVINTLGGEDNIVGSKGNDLINGGGSEYDQVVYDGTKADYIFSLSSEGVVSVIKPDGGIDSLTNIDGFWFNGEEAWYSVLDVLPPKTNDGVINGTNGDDNIFGTSGDEVINLFLGRDVVTSSAGNDVIIGNDTSYDQVDYYGSPSDYTFTREADNSITVLKPNGETDSLVSIDGFWFGGTQEWLAHDALVPFV